MIMLMVGAHDIPPRVPPSIHPTRPTHPSWPHQMSHPGPARPGHRQLPFRLLLYSCCWQQRQRLNSSIQQWNIIILCADTPWTEILIDPIDSNAAATHAHTHQRVFYSIHPPSTYICRGVGALRLARTAQWMTKYRSRERESLNHIAT